LAADELKALTVINLPFIEERYQPGMMIPRSAFDRYIEAAETALGPEADVPSADDVIAEMIEWGSLSEDADAELHPNHRPVAVGQPTVANLVEQAKLLVSQLEESGESVPAKLRELSEMSHRQISTADEGLAGEPE